MPDARSSIAGKSRTTERTDVRTVRTASSSSASSSSDSRRSSSKCMTDSRCGAPRGSRTLRIRPLPSRSVAMIGCSSRVTPSPREASSPLTESTRNGRSSVLVSSTEPSGS